jgi:hypothetical protein
MDELSKRLAKAKVIGLDISLFIYFLENNVPYGELAQITICGIEKGKWQGITSTITLMEITVRPWQLGLETAAREYEAVLLLNCEQDTTFLHPTHCRWQQVSVLEQRHF